MKNIIFILFLFCSIPSYSQIVFDGCVTIDFESIPNETPFSGLVINDQFLDTIGLSFSLETGGFPVLASVGSPVEAFASAWGDDTPAPGVDLGSFFLTDDGVLAGLDSPPIILEFEEPVDSFGGCILDMDLGEVFIIHARGPNEELILVDTVQAGDPGTGDGALTCWGFNFNGCEGTIHSIRFEGKRDTPGSFGMGLENLSFCLTGVDIVNLIDVQTTPITCSGLPGSATLINLGSDTYEYSINGSPFQTDPTFEGLDLGEYTVVIRDEEGCEAEVNLDIGEPVGVLVSDIAGNNDFCNLGVGSFEVFVSNFDVVSYSLDSINFQDSPVFENVPAGTYTVYLTEPGGCVGQETIVIDNVDLLISDVATTNTICDQPNGTLTVTPSYTDGVSYSIDGVNFQENPVFENLVPNTYTVTVIDVNGCEVTSTGVIVNDELLVTNINVTGIGCEESSGALEIESSYTQGLTYTLDGINFQSENIFTTLPAGDYAITITDAFGCSDTGTATIPPGNPLLIDDVTIIDDYCNDSNGTVTLIASGGTGNYEYAINENPFQQAPTLTNLAAGLYTATVQDDNGCTAATEVDIPPGVPIVINEVQPVDPTCQEIYGSISLTASGGNGSFTYSINSENPQTFPAFYNLDGGDYNIVITDAEGCQDSAQALLTLPICPIYIPNAFSPNADGINDFFEAFTNSNYDVGVIRYAIFDRWGELLWDSSAFTLHTASSNHWWDGNFRGRPCMVGVYVYLIEVEYHNGTTELFAGDLTLLR